MSRIRRCIVKTCEFNSGTDDKNIRMFRIPSKNIDLKKKWVKNISEANNEAYLGNGLVCIRHFTEDQIKFKKDKPELVDQAIPTEFFVELIEADECDDIDENHATEEKNENVEEESMKFLRYRMNFEVERYKLNDVIKKQLTEINDLKKKLADSQTLLNAANKKLEQCSTKASIDTNVRCGMFYSQQNNSFRL